jgi:hypothetical protein
MAFLFTVEERTVRPTIEALLITPFKQIWERDETKFKERAISEFSYIEFMTSQKKSNPFKGYSESIKHINVKKNCFGEEDWEPDDLIKDGIEFIITLQTEASPTYTFLMSARKGADQMKMFFDTLDMNDVNMKTGNPLYKPREITSALKDTDDVVTKLDKLQKKVEEELFDTVAIKSGKEISPFADPNNKQ